MNHHAEQVLRRAVQELAAEASGSADLARRAAVRGRLIRHRRRTGGATLAVAAVAVIGAPFLLLSPNPAGPRLVGPVPTSTSATPTPSAPAPSAGTPGPTTDWRKAPVELPGGWLVTGATSTGEVAWNGQRATRVNYVLDRSRGRYVGIEAYDAVWPAPRGEFAAVFDEDRRTQSGLLNIRTGKVRWFQTGQPILTPQWSPDGDRLLLTLLDKGTGSFSFGIITATDGGFRSHAVAQDRYLCTDWCMFTWRPDGREVALSQTDRNAPRSESTPHPRRGVQLFSADDGRPTRLIPVKGDVYGATDWSPDGRLVVVKGQSGPQLVEVDTGRVVRDLPTAYAHWVAPDRILYLGEEGARYVAILVDPSGNELERRALPADLRSLALSIAPR